MRTQSPDTLAIIDALGPFVVSPPSSGTVNWSKVPFSAIETHGRLPDATQQTIAERFERYIDQIAALGYDSVSVDDLAHLVHCDFYHDELCLLINDYVKLYKRLFAIATSRNIKIFVNTDYLFYNDDIQMHLEQTDTSPEVFFETIVQKAFATFPEISGIILRIGEKDGHDVSGHFLSKLTLRTPHQANKLLAHIVPTFEQHGKLLVFRTWTVGAYKIGDLIWNETTFDTVFGSIRSDALIISMKFGDTDFMRYLELNPLFLQGPHKKLLELQTRREWEGMGTYPSFVGWDYQQYIDELQSNDTFIGIHVWCQTGGWAKAAWTNLTYLDDSSLWNELNTEVTIDMYRHNMSVEQSIAVFCKRRGIKDSQKFTELLRYAEIAVKKGLYIADLAEQTLYFRRTRIPPQLWLTWDKIHLPPIVVYLHRMLLPKKAPIVKDGDDAVHAAMEMIRIAENLQLDETVIRSLRFEHATLSILAMLRHSLHSKLRDSQIVTLQRLLRDYETTYPEHYIVDVPLAKRRRLPRTLLKPFVRDARAYRKRDKMFIKTSPLQARLIRLYLRRSRSHLANQAMGFETLFK